MIPQISLAPNLGLPDATALPSLPFSYPAFELPRWTPIPPRVPVMEDPTAPNVAPTAEAPVSKPVPKPMPKPISKPIPEPRPVQQPMPKPEPIKEEPAEVINETVVIELPFVGEIPVPSKELVITAGSTAAIAASVSVVAALSATWLLKFLMKVFKPTIKFLLKKVLKKNNKFTENWARKPRVERLHLRK